MGEDLKRLERNINDHSKHYRMLILWCKGWGQDKRRKPTITGTAFDLCHILGEGSTVAHKIWYRYSADAPPETDTVPLSVVEEVLRGFSHVLDREIVMGNIEMVMDRIKQKAGL